MLASADLVDPDLTSLVDLLSVDEAYSYLFDGNMQTLDHVLANASLMKRFTRFHYARNNADFPESYRNDPNRPERLSDHDMPVAYLSLLDAPVLSARAAGRQVQLNWTNVNAAGYALYRSGEVDGGRLVRIAQVPGTQFLLHRPGPDGGCRVLLGGSAPRRGYGGRPVEPGEGQDRRPVEVRPAFRPDSQGGRRHPADGGPCV